MKEIYLKQYTPYAKGVVGCDIQLSWKERIKILFSKSISVVFVGEDVRTK